MLRSYFNTAIRYIIRNILPSFIQILSLAIGLTVFTIVVLYLYDELTVDRKNADHDQVYRIEVSNRLIASKIGQPWPLAALLLEEIPEIQSVTRIKHGEAFFTVVDESGKPGKQIFISDFLQVDPGFQYIFPQEYLLGDSRTSLRDPYSVVLTSSVSKMLFGSENPVGKTVYQGGALPMTITGVIKDPLNTHLKFQMLESASTWESIRTGESLRFWIRQFRPVYIKLHGNADWEEVAGKISDACTQLWRRVYPNYNAEWEIFLCPLKDVHFSEEDPGIPYMTRGNRNVVMNFFLLGLTILMLGIINYANLTMARATIRRREISLRKIVGSSRWKLILYFLTESIITTFLSFLIALIILQLLFQTFNRLLQADINLYFLNHPLAWILGLIAIFLIGIVSGIYPAISMSSGTPVMALSGNSRAGKSGLITRRILMMVQFTSAVILMIGILVMHLQIRYMKGQDLRFNAERIVWIQLGEMNTEHKRLLTSRLERYPEIEKACWSNNVPGTFSDNLEVIDNEDHPLHGQHVDWFRASPNFFKVYGLKLTRGAGILDHISLRKASGNPGSADSINYYVINETWWKFLNQGDTAELPPWITGIVQDFHCRSHQFGINPLCIELTNTDVGHHTLSIRINSPDMQGALRKIQYEIREVRQLSRKARDVIQVPPRNLNFVDETINRQYDQVQRIHDASVYLFILAMIIACLGLFGLSTFMVQRRVKEIGIRKVMGSSEMQIFMLLARDLTRWIVLSILIGCPAGWFIMNQWLQDFAYRISFSWWIFALAIVITFTIACLTVGWQSIKTARTNPVEALRYE